MSYGIEVDASRFPVVVVRTGEDYGVEHADATFAAFERFAAQGRFAAIIDLSLLRTTNAVRRRRVQELANAFFVGAGQGRFLAEAIVCPSAFARALVTGFYWFAPPKGRASRVFGTFAEAERFAHSVLKDAA